MKTLKHACRFCGHKGTCRGAGAELAYDGSLTHSHWSAKYSCKDAGACGARIRARKGRTLEEARADGAATPF